MVRIGNNHPDITYTMQDNVTHAVADLEESDVEKDLGLHVESHLNYAQHICQAKNKGNMLLVVIRRTYEYLDEESLMLLYKGLVRPAVEYGVVVWAPGLQRDIEAIESVQRRATRLVPGLKG